jgi:hypothetical protein
LAEKGEHAKKLLLKRDTFFKRNSNEDSFSQTTTMKTFRLPALLCFVLFSIIGPTVQARIGETVAQIEARYGKSVGEFSSKVGGRHFLKYRFKSCDVDVLFQDGLSVWESFEANENDEKSPVPDEIFDKVLEVNGGKDKFAIVKRGPDGSVEWLRKDGEIIAVRFTGGGMRIHRTDLDKPKKKPIDTEGF